MSDMNNPIRKIWDSWNDPPKSDAALILQILIPIGIGLLILKTILWLMTGRVFRLIGVDDIVWMYILLRTVRQRDLARQWAKLPPIKKYFVKKK